MSPVSTAPAPALRRRPVRWRCAGALALGLACGSLPRAEADGFRAREEALKALGIDAELRPRIHRAIDLAVRRIVRLQQPDGAYREAPPNTARLDAGRASLLTLALAHASTTESMPAARRGARRLFVEDSGDAAALRGQTYLAGIAGLLAADPSCEVPPKDAADIGRALAGGQDGSTGWWAYNLGRTSKLRPGAAVMPGAVNLSTTQFAVLGLWGLSRARFEVPERVWIQHAKGICRYQSADGSWPYGPATAKQGYVNGTFMGIASVLVAEGALRKDAGPLDVVRDLAVARTRGLSALRRDAAAFFRANEALRSSRGRPGTFDAYGLYALEKACLFAGIDRIEGWSWYERGATLLVEAQDEDGGWNHDLVSTAFGLLFLVRSPERHKPTVTVTEAPRPTAPVTPPPPPTIPGPPPTTTPSEPGGMR